MRLLSVIGQKRMALRTLLYLALPFIASTSSLNHDNEYDSREVYNDAVTPFDMTFNYGDVDYVRGKGSGIISPPALPVIPSFSSSPSSSSSSSSSSYPSSTSYLDGFQRNRRKHARPMFYLNCDMRNLCYCYSKITRHHYCCSCDMGACFPASAHVTTPEGSVIPMNSLKTGDKVLSANGNGDIIRSEILGFLDRRPFEVATYMTLSTAIGQNLTLSANHIVYKRNLNGSQPITDFAQNVEIGEFIYYLNGSLLETEVISISYLTNTGAFVPLTYEGNLIVNGFLTSCYASFPHSLVHAFLKPVRIFPAMLRLRLPGIFPHEEQQLDPASEEGDGESLFVSFIKRIGDVFYPTERVLPDVLKVSTVPQWNSFFWMSPSSLSGTLVHSLTEVVHFLSYFE